jgi:hypothetical protein
LVAIYSKPITHTPIAQPRPLPKHGEIIYELLWALFKPNEILYARVIFDCGAEKEDDFKRNY